MRIIFMGTPELSRTVLQALLAAGHEIILTITQPDKEKGRGKAVQMSPVKELALERGIPVFQPDKIRREEHTAWLQDFCRENPADIGAVAAFGQLLPQRVLDLPRLGCLNVHTSLLPKYRGAAPIQKAILEGEKETGVTIMQMDAGLDTGDILLQRSLPIEET
ncbi:MAG: methionyl-tRNA formyltransferase, partial [Lachnospiraceae bacterium]|nr:methionyl-tRNA formyltransferase [Lachnospiraceae bacterium]